MGLLSGEEKFKEPQNKMIQDIEKLSIQNDLPETALKSF